MTPEGAALLAAELRKLDEVERPRAAAALAAAETADEAPAIRHLAEIERRISYLSRMQAVLEVIALPATTERVVFGLVARVREEDGLESEYRIVGVDESDPERGLVSWASPIAKALVGHRVGDRTLCRLPKGEKAFLILEISKPGA
jgi:transcription elongation factor GreB